MKDILFIVLNILQELYKTSFDKTKDQASEVVEKIFRDIDGGEGKLKLDKPKPILFPNDGFVLAHKDSPRYMNGELIPQFYNFNNLPEGEFKQTVLRTKELYQSQLLDYDNVKSDVIRFYAKMFQHTPRLSATVQNSVMLTLLPAYLYHDEKFIDDINYIKGDNKVHKFIIDNLEDLQNPPDIMVEVLEDIDPKSHLRNKIKNFVDKYYGLGFLDNF